MELIKNLKETSIIKNLFIAICGTILLAVSAKVKIPFYPVPMTCLLYTSDAADE